MTKWDDALAAYDVELEVLEEIREEYGAFLGSTFAVTQKAIEERLGKEWSGKPSGDGPNTSWYAQPRSVRIAAWGARTWGGPAATLVCGILLDVRAGFSKELGALRRKLFLAAAEADLGGTLPGSVPDVSLHGECDESYVRVSSTSIGSKVEEDFATEARSLADLASVLDRWVSRTSWATDALDGLLAKPPPVENASGLVWHANKRQRWAAGFFVQLDREVGGHEVWICVRPPGDVVLAHSGGGALDDALRKRLEIESTTIDGESYPDTWMSMLIDRQEIARLHAKGASDVIADRASMAFREYYRLAK